jgi:hypothetical protein
MTQGQTLYLHTMLENGDLEKVIVNGISFIHHSLQTTINKAIQTLTSDQHTTNDLSTLILATDILPANVLGEAIKVALLPIRGWKRLTNIVINTLKTESTQKESTEFRTASIVLKLVGEAELQEIQYQYTDFFVEHIGRVWNNLSNAKQRKPDTTNKPTTLMMVH